MFLRFSPYFETFTNQKDFSFYEDHFVEFLKTDSTVTISLALYCCHGNMVPIQWMGFSSWAYRIALPVKNTYLWKQQTDLTTGYEHKISHANLARNVSYYWQQTQKSSETW